MSSKTNGGYWQIPRINLHIQAKTSQCIRSELQSMLAQRAPVLDRFGDVGAADGGVASQIGDGTRHF